MIRQRREELLDRLARMARPAHDFNAVHQVHVQREFAAVERLVVNRIVEAMAVDKHQHPATIIAGAADAPHADVGVAAVISDVEAAHAPKHVGQRLVAELLDVVGRHDAHRRGRLRGLLLALGGGIDGAHLHLHEFLEAELLELVGEAGGGRRVRRQQRHGNQQGRAGDQRTEASEIRSA